MIEFFAASTPQDTRIARFLFDRIGTSVNELIDQRDLSQTEAAHITGMTQPKVSQVRRYKLQNISLERLMQALVSLDQHVEIVVQPARHEYAPGITVAV